MEQSPLCIRPLIRMLINVGESGEVRSLIVVALVILLVFVRGSCQINSTIGCKLSYVHLSTWSPRPADCLYCQANDRVPYLKRVQPFRQSDNAVVVALWHDAPSAEQDVLLRRVSSSMSRIASHRPNNCLDGEDGGGFALVIMGHQ